MTGTTYDGPLEGWLGSLLGCKTFLNAGGCRLMGTERCINCPLAAAIPRDDCDMPDECPHCPQRDKCPCGCEAVRDELLKDEGTLDQ